MKDAPRTIVCPITHQWRRLLEIQQIQTELIGKLARRRPGEEPR